MCLGIPMQVKEINGVNALCSAGGIERNVNLYLLQHEKITVDDFVMVHVGYAIQKIMPLAARTSWELYDQMTKG